MFVGTNKVAFTGRWLRHSDSIIKFHCTTNVHRRKCQLTQGTQVLVSRTIREERGFRDERMPASCLQENNTKAINLRTSTVFEREYIQVGWVVNCYYRFITL